jgi:hypothetical protein
MRLSFSIIFLIFSAHTSSACDVMKQQYNQLKMRMTYAEAVKVLGCDGEEISSSEVAGFKTNMYMWHGTGDANMNAMFENGRLISKAQMGLRYGVEVQKS